jgi:hypothetical protein
MRKVIPKGSVANLPKKQRVLGEHAKLFKGKKSRCFFFLSKNGDFGAAKRAQFGRRLSAALVPKLRGAVQGKTRKIGFSLSRKLGENCKSEHPKPVRFAYRWSGRFWDNDFESCL